MLHSVAVEQGADALDVTALADLVKDDEGCPDTLRRVVSELYPVARSLAHRVHKLPREALNVELIIKRIWLVRKQRQKILVAKSEVVSNPRVLLK